GDGARGDVTNAAFEVDTPLVTAVDGSAHVEAELDVRACFAGALAKHELIEQGALAPVDVARIVAVAHGAETEHLVARAASGNGAAPQASACFVIAQPQWIDGGIDDELAVARDFARLFEKAERKAGGDAKSDVAITSSPLRRATIGGDLCAVGT